MKKTQVNILMYVHLYGQWQVLLCFKYKLWMY